ncbi:MAG: hypothetical protein Kow00104_11500 [Rhodothalassiaceae bacterium]
MLLMCYFLYHAFQGEHGLIALRELDRRAALLELELAGLGARRSALESETALMRPDALDPDMLDEQARRALGLVHPDEVVILDPDRLRPD